MPRRRRSAVFAVASVLALAGAIPVLGGCGQSGPLYLPPPKPKHPTASAAAPRTSPAPAARTR